MSKKEPTCWQIRRSCQWKLWAWRRVYELMLSDLRELQLSARASICCEWLSRSSNPSLFRFWWSCVNNNRSLKSSLAHLPWSQDGCDTFEEPWSFRQEGVLTSPILAWNWIRCGAKFTVSANEEMIRHSKNWSGSTSFWGFFTNGKLCVFDMLCHRQLTFWWHSGMLCSDVLNNLGCLLGDAFQMGMCLTLTGKRFEILCTWTTCKWGCFMQSVMDCTGAFWLWTDSNVQW